MWGLRELLYILTMSSGRMTTVICQNVQNCILRKMHFTVCNVYLHFKKGKKEGEGGRSFGKAQLVLSLQRVLTF